MQNVSGKGFNLSILECKCKVLYIDDLLKTVLIYPYWNVNKSLNKASKTKNFVLIYPYWNVNSERTSDIYKIK